MTGNAKLKPARITNLQAGVLCYIEGQVGEDILGRSPKLKIIAKEFGIGTSSVWSHIESLKKKGCIEGESDAARSLRLTELGEVTVTAWRARNKPQRRERARQRLNTDSTKAK